MALSYRSSKTEVRPSPIHGLGLFAAVPIARGEIVCIKGGAILSHAEWQRLEVELGAAEIQIDSEFFIAPPDAEQREGAMLYSNHSCEPNIGIQGQIVFLALRDITPGEELTHDWATTDDLDYQIPCQCGTPHCRGVLTGQDWRRKDLQDRYRGYFAWHIQRKIDALSSAGAGH